MAEKIRKLSNSEIEVLAKIVGECMTGTQMDSIFHECGVRDISNESTKWIERNVKWRYTYGTKCNST